MTELIKKLSISVEICQTACHCTLLWESSIQFPSAPCYDPALCLV